MIAKMTRAHIRQHDAELGELGEVLEPHFERAFREALANLQLYRVGRSVYVRGRKNLKLIAVGFYDGWITAMKSK